MTGALDQQNRSHAAGIPLTGSGNIPFFKKPPALPEYCIFVSLYPNKYPSP